MPGFSKKPSNYEFLKKIRSNKKVALKPCKYLKPETKLRAYQAIGTIHFLSLKGFILGDGVGLGKTIQAIASYAYDLEKNSDAKLLVITPKSATEQWEEEIHKFCTGVTTHILTNEYGKIKDKDEYGKIEDLKSKGIKHKKIRGFEARKAQYDTISANVLIMGYAAAKGDYEFIIKNRLPRYTVIFDEVQEIKNEKTQAHLSAEKLSEKADKVYGLSATIIKNRLEEAYNIFNVIVPGLFPGKIKFYSEYTIRKKMSINIPGSRKKRYFNKVVGYKNLEQFKQLIDPYFLIRKTREVADELPRLISNKLSLEMTEKQSKLYKQALDGDLYRRIIKEKYFEYEEYYNKLATPTEKEEKIYDKLKERYDESLTKEGVRKNKIAALAYCQIVSNGPGWLKEEGDSSKEIEFKRLFDQELSNDKVIVFTRFKTGIPILEKILDDLEIKHTRITGEESAEERRDARKKFQEQELKSEEDKAQVIFITTAGSAAINLQKARVILFYDTPWSYGDLYQTIGRAQRIGSLHSHVLLLHMVNKGTIDEHVLKILETKKSLINTIMGDIAEGAVDFSAEKLESEKVLFKEEQGEIDELFKSVFR